MFISKERKLSELKGTGVQYILGHVEPLVDFVVEKYLPESDGNILDLAGGGLRFAIPVAAYNRRITVVDLDPSGLDVDLIYSKLCENELLNIPDINLLKNNILPIVDDVFNFLETSKETFSLITAFRIIHFFNAKEVDQFFRLISKRIKKSGKIVISAMTPFEQDNITYNEFFNNSNAVKDNSFYRKFKNRESAKKLQSEQNMGDFIHLFSENYIVDIAKGKKLKLVLGNLSSTRIVRGYVFTK